MVIPENNYWPEVDFCCLNHQAKQTERAIILFQLCPDIKKASRIVQQLRNIYNQTTDIRVAYTKLAHWYKLVEESRFKAFNIVAKSITLNYKSILNYFKWGIRSLPVILIDNFSYEIGVF